MPKTITFYILGCSIEVHCLDSKVQFLLMQNFGGLAVTGLVKETPDLKYIVGRNQQRSEFRITRLRQPTLRAKSTGEFLYLFEKDITIELQKLRQDLYFLHSAALEYDSKTILLVGESGSGKSTTAWALSHYGFRYLSDELSPINLDNMTVLPYQHALCLKEIPPQPYSLPKKTLRTSWSYHVPVECIPGGLVVTPTPLVAILLVHYTTNTTETDLRPISTAEASAHLFANALNSLAHPNYGLTGAIKIAHKCHCFQITPANLNFACTYIQSLLERLQND